MNLKPGRKPSLKLYISRSFKLAIIKYSKKNPLWYLAASAGMNSSTFSRILNGRVGVTDNKKPSVLKVAKLIGFTGAIFLEGYQSD